MYLVTYHTTARLCCRNAGIEIYYLHHHLISRVLGKILVPSHHLWHLLT